MKRFLIISLLLLLAGCAAKPVLLDFPSHKMPPLPPVPKNLPERQWLTITQVPVIPVLYLRWECINAENCWVYGTTNLVTSPPLERTNGFPPLPPSWQALAFVPATNAIWVSNRWSYCWELQANHPQQLFTVSASNETAEVFSPYHPSL
jgi:hypothetical protein